ncbi:MAG: glycosyltransferase [Cyanobacteria bacterium P01_F01_bin.150]
MAYVPLEKSSSPTENSSSLQSQDDAAPSILLLCLEIFSQEGGIQSYIKDIFYAYKHIDADRNDQPLQADVFLLRDRSDCENPFQSSQPSKFTFHYFQSDFPVLGRIKFAIALFLYLLRQRPERVYCGHILLTPLVQRLCRWFDVPYTVLTYGKEVWRELEPSYKNALQQADSIWTISRYTGDCLCQFNQIPFERLKFLPCAIDEAYFTPGPKNPQLLDRYSISPDSKLMVTVARLWSGDIYKGVDVTIRALPAIRERIPNIRYLVIGRGDDQPRLAKLAKDLGVEGQVIFAGFVPVAELRDHYRLADAYVMPSQEGFGIVYLEAMACGIPVVSGDADGSSDPLQDGRVGWQVPHRNSQAVADACIEVLLGNDQRCNGKWLREEAIATFGQAMFRQRLQALLQSN